MRTKTEHILLAAFVATEGAHAFSAFCPSIFTIHRFRDEHTREDILKGCLLASGFCILLGGLVSGLTHTYLPLMVSAGVAVGMSAVYMAAVEGKI